MLGMIFVLIETVDQLTVSLVMEPLIRQINCWSALSDLETIKYDVAELKRMQTMGEPFESIIRRSFTLELNHTRPDHVNRAANFTQQRQYCHAAVHQG